MLNGHAIASALLMCCEIAAADNSGKASGPLEAGDTPLHSNAKMDDWTTDSSGLRWRRIKGDGTGVHPALNDSITVYFTGKISNGLIFEQTSDGRPANIALNTAIRGWQIALPNFGVGDVAEIIVPSELGYGALNVGVIPSDAILFYSVEIIGINDPRPGPQTSTPPWPSDAKLLKARTIQAKGIGTHITVDGKLIANWYLSSATYDYLEVSQFGVVPGSELCMETEIDRSCVKIDDRDIAVFRVSFRGSTYTAYIGVMESDDNSR
jgi:FKBP-type peptidyl-prolyl cis-trans isomerase FkpA